MTVHKLAAASEHWQYSVQPDRHVPFAKAVVISHLTGQAMTDDLMEKSAALDEATASALCALTCTMHVCGCVRRAARQSLWLSGVGISLSLSLPSL